VLTFVLVNLLLVIIAALLTAVFSANLIRPVRSPLLLTSPPRVSVIVPARNEEKNVERCVRSLLAQDYENYEVVVIDDRSTDQTSAIVEQLAAADHRLRLLHSNDAPPEGWTGKCYVLSQAVQNVDGDWLMFVDADTLHSPSAVSHAVSCAITTKAHMVSFWPLHEVRTFWEQLITPLLWNTFFWCDPLQTVNDLSMETAYAVGHCMLINRRVYDFIGGHAAVREWIIEDHGLAKVVKNRGFHLIMADGRNLLQVRMYETFETIWHGWAKMLYACLAYNNWALLWILLLLVGTLVLPFFTAAYLIWLHYSGAANAEHYLSLQVCAVELTVMFLWWLSAIGHCKGGRWWHFPLLPLGAAVLAACYLRSAQLVNSGGTVSWRGRNYKVSRLKIPGTN
jgi:chlorobactene glucosyltransferase